MGFDQACAEVEQTCPLGLTGLDQLDWGGQAGACWEVWKISPCCGSPDILDALLCLLHWCFLGPCSSCKLYASSLGDQCSLWPHCVCVCCLCYAGVLTRYNLRKKAGAPGNIVGDFVCLCCCGCCSFCQELRSVEPAAWRWIPEFVIPGIYIPGCKLIV